jgi:hypothetical protein
LTLQAQCITQIERNYQVLNYANITWNDEIKLKIRTKTNNREKQNKKKKKQ